MAEYLIQKDTVTELSQYTRSITGAIGTFTASEISEILKAEQGEEKKYTVLAIDYDGTVLKRAQLNTGAVFYLPSPPEINGYTFEKWTSSANIVDGKVVVNGQDVIIEANYNINSGATEFTTISTSTVTLPTITGEYSVDWGDGATDGSLSHTYSSAGVYIIKVYGATAFSGTSSSVHDYFSSVKIGDSVTQIGEFSFYKCTNLSYIMLNKVESIGRSAFFRCTSLTSINIPNSVSDIGISAFNGCDKVTTVKLGRNIKTIGSKAYSSCTNISDVYVVDLLSWCNIPAATYASPIQNSGVLYVGGVRPSGVVEIPEGATRIPSKTFDGCDKITEVIISSTVTSIDNYAFQNCSNLTIIRFLGSQVTCSYTAFLGCILSRRYVQSLEACCGISFGNPISGEIYIGENRLSGDIVIPDGVTSIGASSFSSNSRITSVNIPSGVTNIGEYAFYKCVGMVSVSIPDSVTSIGEGAFSGCQKLVSVTIPSGVTTINSGIFDDCCGLTEIIIPESVTSVAGAFLRGCSSLSSITTPSVFDGYHTFGYWFGTSNYAGSILVSQINKSGSSTKIVDYYIPMSLRTINIVGTTLDSYVFSCLHNDIDIVFGGGFTSFGKSALSYATLGSVVLQDGATIYSNSMHCATKIKNLTLPSSITTIHGQEVYSSGGSTEIQNLYITDLKAWCNINVGLTAYDILDFVETMYLNNKPIVNLIIPGDINKINNRVFFGYKLLENIVLQSGVSEIGDYAFGDCGDLNSVRIPKTVTSIGTGVFRYSNLTSAVYEGTAEEWANVTVGSYNENLTDVLTFAG